jgi:hypothetical protein
LEKHKKFTQSKFDIFFLHKPFSGFYKGNRGQNEKIYTNMAILAILSTSHFILSKKKKNDPQGAGGSTKVVSPQIFIFCNLKPKAKLHNPTLTPSGRKVTQQKREREKEKTCKVP